MYPEKVEEVIRQKATEMKLSKDLNAYGYEAIEHEILCQVFGELFAKDPDTVNSLIAEELDFYLAPAT
jgi:hypothetical protein